VFNLKSPENHRPNVQDVILLFTDGEPIRRDWEKNQEFKTENLMAEYYSDRLKEKNVTVIGMAVGSPKQLDNFYEDIVKWSSSPDHVFSAKVKELDTVLNQLISAAKKCSRRGCKYIDS
jgi:exopolysaccharide biosynthesis predicted pyruvyltransferase EpsI